MTVENSLLLAGNFSVTAFDPCSEGWSDSFPYGCVEASPSENRTRLSRRSLVGESESMCRAPRRLLGAFDSLFVFLLVLLGDLG